MGKLIGLSVSHCISDILDNKVTVAEVEAICAGTRMRDLDGVAVVAENYSKSYWRKDPVTAVGLLYYFWLNGKIYEPRADGIDPPNVARSWWIEVSE